MRVLVTGANGFLGRHVVKALLARDVTVRALVRPGAKVEALGWPEAVEIVRADLRTSRDLERAFDAVDAVIHLAAVVAGDEDAQFAGTVVGTERLLEGMARSTCSRIVLASSFCVYDFTATKGVLDEESPIHEVPTVYSRDGYTIAKWWQERVARRSAEKHSWDLTVLRPGFIWGPGAAYLSPIELRLGRHYLVIGPGTRLPLTHVENCAEVFALAAIDNKGRNQTFNVVDGPGTTIWRYLSDYMRGTGDKGWRIAVPFHLARAIIATSYWTIFRRAKKLPGLLIPNRFDSRLKPLRYDNSKLRKILGWSPALSHEACVARTYAMPKAQPGT